MVNLEEVFENLYLSGEYNRFERVENPLHSRPDICAFILLDKLCPNPGRDMVSASDLNEIWLSVDCEQLAAVISPEDIRTLVRCGVRYDEVCGYLALSALSPARLPKQEKFSPYP